jgi:hypothetical protein
VARFIVDRRISLGLNDHAAASAPLKNTADQFPRTRDRVALKKCPRKHVKTAQKNTASEGWGAEPVVPPRIRPSHPQPSNAVLHDASVNRLLWSTIF